MILHKDAQDRIFNCSLFRHNIYIMPEGLHRILGADNKNNFTIYKDSNNNKFYVYFGLGLLEVLKTIKTTPKLNYF